MDYLKNHCWCSSSHWDNSSFNCQIIVSLSSYQEGYKEDWQNLTHKVEVFSQAKMDQHMDFVDRFSKRHPEASKALKESKFGNTMVNQLKPEVLNWLEENIPDQDGEKAWCVGSDDYNIGGSCSELSIFMQRTSDAMRFIKVWSKWKKPINYCQYFTDVRKRLNLETLKYEFR